jgi:RNA polymerase sigma factor (sigma-70 family)
MELPGDPRAIADMDLTDPAVFEAVFAAHFQAVYAYAARRVGEPLGEEVAAETFARAFAVRARYDDRGDVLPWLMGIASNLLRRHWRSERRRLNAYARSLGPEACEDPQSAREAIEAVARLPRRQREVVLLHVWADLSYEQIARALDIPVGTVRSRLHRARGALGQDPTLLEPSRA